jgi:hypothetical protein
MINKSGAGGKMRIGRENQSTGRKPAPMSFWHNKKVKLSL